MDFDPEVHEQYVSERLQYQRELIAKVALFDELIDMHLDGICTFDEAIDQYKHDCDNLEV